MMYQTYIRKLKKYTLTCSLLLSTLLLSALVVAEERCLRCNDQIILNQARVQCFMDQYSDRLSRLKKSNRGWININLEKCQANKPAVKKKGLDVIVEFDSDTSKIVLDSRRLLCLKEHIDKNATTYGKTDQVLNLLDVCKTS